MKNQTKGSLILLLTAAIWGFAFVAQSSAMDSVEPFTFTGIRFCIGAMVLLPVIIIKDGKEKRRDTYKKTDRKTLIIAGVLCGLALFTGSILQQLGIAEGADTGKAGFLTAIYILLVPVIGIFFKKKVALRIWLCVVMALAGIYFLSVKKSDGFALEKADVLLIICAFAYSIQITLVDYFVNKTDAVKMAALQFLTAGIIGLIFMIFTETPDRNSIMDAALPILYTGVLSSGVAYTLQIVGQKYSRPTEASLIMSLESAFALIGGMIILKQFPSGREWIGMGIMFVAIMLSQMDLKAFRK